MSLRQCISLPHESRKNVVGNDSSLDSAQQPRIFLNCFLVSSGVLTRHDSADIKLGLIRMIWKVSNHSFRIQFLCLVSLVLFADITFAGQAGSDRPLVVEVFISDKHVIIGADAAALDSNSRQPAIVVYKIDAIQSIERDLSANLPVEPLQSKQIVLHRIQSLGEQTRSRMQAAAMGLAKAMQYGIDRYPAIVFDNQAVVYGVTDLKAALGFHQAWRAGVKP